MSILQKDFGEILKMAILLLKECVWVWLLAASKPVNRPGWWKGKLALIQLLATGGEGWWTSAQRLTWGPPSPRPILPASSGARDFTGRRRGLHADTVHDSDSVFKLVIWVVLGPVSLQFQGLFVPTSLRPILGTVAAHVLGTVWSLRS